MKYDILNSKKEIELNNEKINEKLIKKRFGVSLASLKEKTDEKRKLISFEQNPEWYYLVQNNFPEELKEYVEIKLLPL